MSTEISIPTKTKELKPKKASQKSEKVVGTKRKASKRTGASSEESLEDLNNLKMQLENDYDLSDLSDDDSSSTNN